MKAQRAQAVLFCLGLLSLCLSILNACGAGSLAPGLASSSHSPFLQSIQVAPSQPSVALGKDQQFSATGIYSDGSTKNLTASVVWASSNTSVVTISGSGFATSRAMGSSTISATFSGVAGYGTLTVTKAILVSITITPANPDVLLGTLQQFTATGTFSDQSTQNITASVTWTSSNNGMLSIQGGGLGAALALGSLTISATSGSISGSTSVSVASAVLSSLTIRPGNGKIAQLTSQQFAAVGTYTDGATRYITGSVSWTSSDTSVAQIASNGRAKGLAPGTTTITATEGSITASATLEVTNATIVSISVKPSGETIAPGTKLAFTAIGSFSDNSTQIITVDSTWASDNPAVATIGSGGLANAIGPGTANISATFDLVSSSAPLYVSSATISSISVTPATDLLTPDTSVSCVATGTFSDGSTQVITNAVKWTSSASTVASVSTGGSVTAHSGGTAIISAQFGLVSGDSTILVESSQLTAIQISPPTASIPEQMTVALHAIGTFADGSTEDLTTFALWTSSAPSVATVNEGRVSGLTLGTATIVALFDGQIGIADLTVTAAKSASQMVSPAAINVEPGGVPQFAAPAQLGDGRSTQVTPSVTGASSGNLAAVTSADLDDTHRGRDDYGNSHPEGSEPNTCSESSPTGNAPAGTRARGFLHPSELRC
jgi:trimeric autotransporter adhesin